MDTSSPIIYIVEPFGGSIRRHNSALPHVFWDDAAVTRGDGVFETLLIRDGHPANLQRHLDRFQASARLMELPEPAADDWIAESAQAADIVVTADIPLARRALEKGAAVLGPTGRPFTAESIGMALAMRELKQHLRETGESRGLNPEFTARDRSQFLATLDEIVVRAKRHSADTAQ